MCCDCQKASLGENMAGTSTTFLLRQFFEDAFGVILRWVMLISSCKHFGKFILENAPKTNLHFKDRVFWPKLWEPGAKLKHIGT